MRTFTLAFLLGILLLQYFPFLPEKKWLFLLVTLVAITSQIKFLRLISASILGFTYVFCFVHTQTAWTLPPAFEGKTVLITGYIASIPDVSDHRTAFLFKI